MARRRSRTSATGGNMDSMLDTLTNVVGILLIVLVTVQLSSQEAAERIAAAVEKLAPEEIARIEQEAEQAKAAADAAQARLDALDRPQPRDPAAEAARLEAESVKSDQAARDAAARAAALEKEKREKSEAARKAAEDAARKAAEAKAKAEKEVQEAELVRQALASELEKTEKPIEPPAKEVRLPDPRPAPPGAQELRVLCREGKIWVVDGDEIQQKVLLRSKPIVERKKLDPDKDGWLTDGKPLEEEFNKDPLRVDDFKLTIVPSGDAFQLVLTRAAGTGQEADAAVKFTGALGKTLRKLKPSTHYIRFFVWHDGFEAYLAARKFVGEKGFAAGWEPQGSPDEHRIGFYKLRIGVKPPPQPPPKDPPKPAPPQNLVD